MEPPRNPVSSWTEYYQATLTKPLNPFYSILEPFLPESGTALELGCGVGQGVLWFLGKGFTVEAMDVQPEAVAILQSRVPEEHLDRLKTTVADLRVFPFRPSAFDVVVAGFCLFFLKPNEFEKVWPDVIGSVARQGLFVGQFLGRNDDWAIEMTTHTQAEVRDLFDGFDILHLEEVDRDGETSQGVPKHWHLYHVIARKR